MRNGDRVPVPPDERAEPDYTIAFTPRQLAGGFAIVAALLLLVLRRRRRRNRPAGEEG
jgi:hypothetical protein